jgi:hypothetical protein
VAALFCKRQRLLFLLLRVIVALVWFDDDCDVQGQSDVASSDAKMSTYVASAALFYSQLNQLIR